VKVARENKSAPASIYLPVRSREDPAEERELLARPLSAARIPAGFDEDISLRTVLLHLAESPPF